MFLGTNPDRQRHGVSTSRQFDCKEVSSLRLDDLKGKRIFVLDGSERVIPTVASVEISEKDVADAKRKVKSQAYPIDGSTDNDDLPRTEQPSGSPPRWVRALVRLILESSFPS